jgi:hypothetical protein
VTRYTPIGVVSKNETAEWSTADNDALNMLKPASNEVKLVLFRQVNNKQRRK